MYIGFGHGTDKSYPQAKKEGLIRSAYGLLSPLRGGVALLECFDLETGVSPLKWVEPLRDAGAFYRTKGSRLSALSDRYKKGPFRGPFCIWQIMGSGSSQLRGDALIFTKPG